MNEFRTTILIRTAPRQEWTRRHDRTDEWHAKLSHRPAEASDALATVRTAIRNAEWLLRLEDDWDGEGAVRPSPEAFRRAGRFLIASAQWLQETYGVHLESPDIGAGPSGSVDLHWALPSFELLVNVPLGGSEPLSFYGDDRGKLVIKGTAADEERGGALLLWLASNLR